MVGKVKDGKAESYNKITDRTGRIIEGEEDVKALKYIDDLYNVDTNKII